LPNVIPAAAQAESIFDNPIFFPARLVLTPLLWVIAKIRGIAQFALGSLLRIGVFPFGETNRSFLKKKIIELYSGGCYDTHKRDPFDPIRCKQAFAVLENMGGVRYNTHSKDGTKLDAMIVRYQDVKRRIEENGGKIVDSFPISVIDSGYDVDERVHWTIGKENHSSANEYVDVIISDHPGEEWETFYQTTLLNLKLEKIELTMGNGKKVNGFILKHWNKNDPIRPKQGQCFVRSNAPTETYASAKRDIMRRVLGTKNDTLCFDYRGTWKSEGVPSEGGYYLDAETMVEQAVNEFGYDWQDIWAEGFCLGGAVAVHLKRKYHDKGINIFLQNTFDCMLHNFYRQIFPANYLAPFCIDEIRSRDPYVCANTEQDNFDSVKKLESLRGKEKKGVSIVINTKTDTTVDPHTYSRLASHLHQISKHTFSVMYRPDKPGNGHSLDIFSDRSMWDKAVKFITAKDYPEVFEPIRSTRQEEPPSPSSEPSPSTSSSLLEKLAHFWG